MRIHIVKKSIDKTKYVRDSIVAAFVGTLILSLVFVGLEPQISKAIEDQFIVTQVVTSEISFATTAANVAMTPSLTGVTGGTSNGTTTVVVLTNDTAGYTMTITASSSPAMQGNTGGGTIADYTPTSTFVPDFAYSVPSGAEFAYTVSASTTSDLAQKFLDNGSACNTGSNDTSGSASCWYYLSTTATSTIVRSTQTAASGSTSSIAFKLTINSGSSVVEDTYTATATLTAFTN